MRETRLSWRRGTGPDSFPASEIHVWKICLEQPLERVQAFQRLLSPGERRRREGIRSDRDKAAFCICHGSLRAILGRYKDIAPERVRLRRGRYGKPALDARFHETDIEFNMSHSGGLALIALARRQRVGVDVQMVDAGARMDDMARRFFSDRENEAIRAQPDMRTAAFYHCWTRKEAAIKARGGSIVLLGNKISVSTTPDKPAQIISMPGRVSRKGWHLQDLPISAGYAAALCYEGPPARVFLWQPED